jgi:hypothetical protein
MPLQVRVVVETLGAELAAERLLLRVPVHVVPLELAVGCKTLAARWAGKGLFSGHGWLHLVYGAVVSEEVVVAAKGLGALVAAKVSLGRVSDEVAF